MNYYTDKAKAIKAQMDEMRETIAVYEEALTELDVLPLEEDETDES